MKKNFVKLFILGLGVVGINYSGVSANAAEVQFNNINSEEYWIDSNLVGTKENIDDKKSEVIRPRVGGNVYKNGKITSYNVTSRTYTGIVTKTSKSWVKVKLSGTIFGVKLSSEAGKSYSETKKAKRYSIKATAKATFQVYDQYSGNYLYSTTTSGNLSGTEDVGI